jgi:hypothetical protein
MLDLLGVVLARSHAEWRSLTLGQVLVFDLSTSILVIFPTRVSDISTVDV